MRLHGFDYSESGFYAITLCVQNRECPLGYSNTIDNMNADIQTNYGSDNKKYHVTIGNIVNWFKTMTTNEYIRGVKNLGWHRFDGKLWQRNYWDDIICSDESLERMAEYILNNPAKWEEYQLNDYKPL
jgi:hypothetical protein